MSEHWIQLQDQISKDAKHVELSIKDIPEPHKKLLIIYAIAKVNDNLKERNVGIFLGLHSSKIYSNEEDFDSNLIIRNACIKRQVNGRVTFTEGKTQTAYAQEHGISLPYVSRLMKELYWYVYCASRNYVELFDRVTNIETHYRLMKKYYEGMEQKEFLDLVNNILLVKYLPRALRSRQSKAMRNRTIFKELYTDKAAAFQCEVLLNNLFYTEILNYSTIVSLTNIGQRYNISPQRVGDIHKNLLHTIRFGLQQEFKLHTIKGKILNNNI